MTWVLISAGAIGALLAAWMLGLRLTFTPAPPEPLPDVASAPLPGSTDELELHDVTLVEDPVDYLVTFTDKRKVRTDMTHGRVQARGFVLWRWYPSGHEVRDTVLERWLNAVRQRDEWRV